MKKNLLLILVLILPMLSFAQRWKKARYEVVFGLGSTTFLGELGGANQIGTHFAKDLEFSQSRPCGTLGLRYRLSEYFATRANLSYGRLKGDDKETAEIYRNFRNLNFVSNVWELTVNFEGAFMKEQDGKKYRLRGVRGKRGYELYTYGFVGFGAFYFNPKGFGDGGLVALQPLHTEGQGLIATRKPYKRLQICLPLGIGFKYTIKKQWSIGLEFGVRYTFTDYIDDVSTTYVSPAILSQQEKGELSVAMANRSADSANPEGLPATVAGPGQQRGDPKYSDAYVFSMLTLHYKLSKSRGRLPKF